MTVFELRVALTVDRLDEAVRLYGDALGLPAVERFDEDGRRGVVLDAGRATLELLSREMTEHVDRVEAGAPTGARVRLALQVEDSAATAQALIDAGAEAIGGPVVTPWGHRNVRLRSPDGLQLTLFSVPDTEPTEEDR